MKKKFVLIQRITYDEYIEIEAENGAQAAVIVSSEGVHAHMVVEREIVQVSDDGYNGIHTIVTPQGDIKIEDPGVWDLIVVEEEKWHENKLGMTKEALRLLADEVNKTEATPCPVCPSGSVYYMRPVTERNHFLIDEDLCTDIRNLRDTDSEEVDWLECSDCHSKWDNAAGYIKALFCKRLQEKKS